MLNINDVVLYTTFGLCTVKGEKEMSFGGKQTHYYVLAPISNPKSSVTIPSNSELLMSRVLPLLDSNEINDIINGISFIEPIWIDNDNLRKAEFTEIIKKGDRREILKIVKSIKYHQVEIKTKNRKLHAVDEANMKDGLRLLSEEFSYVLDKEFNEMQDLILSKM